MLRSFQLVTLFLVGFTLPIQGYSLLATVFPMTPSKLVTAVLLMLGVLQFALTGRRPPPDGKRIWLAIFTASYVISSVVGLIRGIPGWALVLGGSQQLALIIYYLLISYVLRSRRDLVLLLWALVLGGAVTSAPDLLGMQTSTHRFDYGERAAGLAGQENVLGFDMAVCVPVAIALFFTARSLLAKAVLVGLGTICAAGLLLSLSRSAMLASAAMGALWLWRSGRVENLRYLVPALAVIAAVFVFSPEAVERRVETMLDPSQRAADNSIQDRFVQYQWALKAIASNPAIGVGVQRFVAWVHEQPGGTGMNHEVHNAYLAVAARQGLLGAVPFVAMLLLTWRQYSRAIRMAKARRRMGDRDLESLGHLANFLQLALLGAMIGGLFHMAHYSKTLWLLLGLSPALVSLCRARADAIQGTAPTQDEERGALPGLLPPMPGQPARTSG